MEESIKRKEGTGNRRVFAHSCHVHRRIFDTLTSEVLDQHFFRVIRPGLSEQHYSHLRNAMTWVLSALYDAHCVQLDRVVLPLGKNSFAGRPFGEKVTRTALTVLANANWTKTLVAQKGLNVRHATEIVATASLTSLFDQIGFIWTQRAYDEKSDVVILRFKSAFPGPLEKLPIPVGPETEQMREEVRRINRAILKHAVLPYLDDKILKNLMDRSDKYHCNFSKVFYRRFFAEGRFDRGGRFFGPWWQTIKREHRRNIRIDGDKTVELDFKSTFITLLYALRGEKLEGDAYDLGLDGNERDDVRDIVKKFVNALLNDPNNWYTPGRVALKKLGVTRNEFLLRTKKKHFAVEDAFGTKVGLSLMYQESKIACDVMMQMIERGLPVLNIHDGFITQERHRDVLEKIMSDTFFKVATIRPGIGQKPSEEPNLAGSYDIYTKYMSTFDVMKQNQRQSSEDNKTYLEEKPSLSLLSCNSRVPIYKHV